jgi:hypothetical protein
MAASKQALAWSECPEVGRNKTVAAGAEFAALRLVAKGKGRGAQSVCSHIELYNPQW